MVSRGFIVAVNNENFLVWFINDFMFDGFSDLISVISLAKEAAAVVDIYGCSTFELYSIADSLYLWVFFTGISFEIRSEINLSLSIISCPCLL